MHPDLLYIMAQQEAEQRRRQAEHSHLSYAIRVKTKRASVPRVIHWLGLVSRTLCRKPTIRV
jgi:hypothetical protein